MNPHIAVAPVGAGTKTLPAAAVDFARLRADLEAAEAVLREQIKECICGGDGIESYIVEADEGETEACPCCASARAYFAQRGKSIEGA